MIIYVDRVIGGINKIINVKKHLYAKEERNMEKYKIRLVKIGKPSTYKFSVIKVDVDKKHRYFIIHTKIYHHEIIETIRFDDCDYIEIFNETSNYGMFVKDDPLKVVNQNGISAS